MQLPLGDEDWVPFQWRNQFWQGLEEDAGKRCSECEVNYIWLVFVQRGGSLCLWLTSASHKVKEMRVNFKKKWAIFIYEQYSYIASNKDWHIHTLTVQDSVHTLTLQDSIYTLTVQDSVHTLRRYSRDSIHTLTLQDSIHTLTLQDSIHTLTLQNSIHMLTL